MTCAEAEPLIGASLDGELDARTALLIDDHVSGCATCLAFMERLEHLRDEIAASELDWSARADLRPLAAAIRRRTGRTSWFTQPWRWRWATGALACAVLVMLAIPSRRAASLDRQIVDSHLRSMMADHLVDVPSSDRHTVKPWFQGKLSFAPAVPDLAAQGFVLIGGRLDVVDGKPAAAIVYKRGQHMINLWMSASQGEDRGVESSGVEGFHLLQWQKSGIHYWTVSDVNEPELRQFAELIRGS